MRRPGSASGSAPFIARDLRPEVKPDDPPPPLLPAAPSPRQVHRHVSRILGGSLSKRLGLRDAGSSRLLPSQHVYPSPDVVWARLDGESVLLDLRSRDSFTLNRPGTLIWATLSEGQSLRTACRALRRQFDVPADLAWSDLLTLVCELRREGLLLDRRPAPVPSRSSKNTDLTSAQRPTQPSARSKPRPANPALAESGQTSAPGLFALNALVLEKYGRGILIAGAGSWQKTPAGRALVSAGYRCLSTATPMLRVTAAGLELLRVPEKVRRGKSATRSRRSLPAKRAISKACPPQLLVFPQTVDWPASSLAPLARSRALEELLPLTLLIRGRAFTSPEFQALARLVETTDCYRLHCGEDVSSLPVLFDGLLKQRKAARRVGQTLAVKPPEANP